MMMELLGEELAAIGLTMHELKTKILITSINPRFHSVEIGGMMIEILQKDHCHRYLGRLLNMDPNKRIDFELQNRVRICWGKFHQHRKWLINLDVPIRLRLRLFDAICSPTILFGSAVLPLNLKQRQSLDILQRKMLRLMVGWRRLPGEEWSETMTRMNIRVENACVQYPIASWETSFHRHRWRYAVHVIQNKKMRWPLLLSQWDPGVKLDDDTFPYRKPGRPFLRWDDSLHDYCCYEWSLSHWTDMMNWEMQRVIQLEDRYVQYCML